jgi:hypothetical protein
MEDLLLELVGWILELLLEAIFEYLAAAVADFFLRSLGEVVEGPERQNPVLSATGYALLGLAVGTLSLLPFPHHLVQPSRIHGVSLLVSPLVTGLMMSWTGEILRRQDKKVTQLESFRYGFTFAFGIALVRFFLAK